MEYLLIFIIILLAIIIYGFVMRKKIYNEVDKLEHWKINIMNRPVTDEIAKVKQLNMTGQTEEKFEVWRTAWDEIITNELPAIEELLFDAEEAADRYMFKKANGINNSIRIKLQEIDEKIAGILADLQELVGSEERNKIEIEELKGIMKQHRKLMLTARHTFGSAIIKLEQELEEITNKFTEFDVTTQGGNYLEAREMVLGIRSELESLGLKLIDLPRLLSLCQTELPSQIHEIRKGQAEMIEAGYVIDHLEINKELTKIEGELKSYLSKLEQTEIEIVKEGISDIQDRIEQIYDCLEREVIAKHIVSKEYNGLEPIIKDWQEKMIQSKQETESVQEIYHLKDKDIEDQRKIEKKVAQITLKYEELVNNFKENNEPATKLRDDLEEIKDSIESVNDLYIQFTEMLHTLRKDEREAKEKIINMRKTIIDCKSLIRNNHLPGLPEALIRAFDTAESNLRAVAFKLDENPLDMYAVNNLLAEAEEAVNKLYEKTEDTVEKAILVEKVIQYGNRYRSQYAILAAKLSEAEHVFRMYDYDLALEQAATAIEEIDPDALKKLNKLVKTQ
ncbi:septation ring formation regulator EzrA [Calidifontibacillus oryziterrae]|uniref:septation ring formation regulator EzrA n=1 Tax=Calidifontibacillus oryziterrae TaxID=1191699 RepID=UPI0002F36B09|nr:septation ring formation regulator EzrA [Calidifontibacillus oryziterrae]